MKREKAYVDGRRSQIVEILNKNPEANVNQLAKRLGVSVITIRRDLQYLEENKQVKRFYGGAVVTDQADNAQDEVSLYRELIARYAATLVEDEDTIFINTSRNALQMIRYVEKDNVTVITNNGKAINYEKGDGVSIILTGGELRYPKEAMVGDFAVRNLQNIFAKKAFVGCSGISSLTGMTTEIANEVNVNQLMIDHATQAVYILADHTKIGRNSSFTSCGIDMVQHLITDEKADPEELELLREKGVHIHQVRRSDF
ncbi:DeoR/GlpR family transcriptional regulator of sugar metabolism [Aequitasia blattaphilus]|uniref:DeoR/GlpR family DNA-binding transcription regulator n=1 Tax=Aequitasia blattaphilus TaxID=2949332 RepID=A0ABT1EAW0_9FIRM|nr:DeoR/GlpR family DNA-binding transcription regulator [Aequitasia blattaphilus]MCP1102974.1 DeoR/GlpR family DNA-binding transcription regulator [Aequitasia blattaphilus]MCR8615614.1 DeoR/GlpR family DNA-binding transcription regulator [Aequitasia blattaphilus]